MNEHEQLTLDDARRLARTTDPGTSHAAARHVAKNLTERRIRVLRLLIEHGPSTYDELAPAEFTNGGKISGRLTELARLGYIEARGTRRTHSGRPATVWEVTEAGHRALAEEE